MMAVTLTEAITDLVFGRRVAAEDLAMERIAKAQEWGQYVEVVTRDATRACQEVGRDLNLFRFDNNSPSEPDELPTEVACLFQEMAKYKNTQEAERNAIGRARQEILSSIRTGLEIWGSFEGGRSERIPLPELRHLIFIDDAERDELCNRRTLRMWSAVSFPTDAFEAWRNPTAENVPTKKDSTTLTTEKKLIRECMRAVYKAAQEQSVAPLNVNEVGAPVLTLLQRKNLRATTALIRDVAGEAEFANQRPRQGTPRPKHLKTAAALKI